MLYPKLNTQKYTRSTVDVFSGYNHNPRIGEGEFYDMLNMSSDCYPLISQRAKRGVYASPETLQGIIAKDKLCYVSAPYFYVGDDIVNLGLSFGEKNLVSMGAYVIIFPDKVYINTMDLEDYGSIDSEWFCDSWKAEMSPCTVDGEEAETFKKYGGSAPENPEDGDLWLDSKWVVRQYDKATGTWKKYEATYVMIRDSGIGEGFNVGDCIEISGFPADDSGEKLEKLNGSNVITAKGDDYIVISGVIKYQYSFEGLNVCIKRVMPEVDFVIESGNRLWGCRYGESEDGEFVNEIYASKLGDFKNWNCFEGVSTDSYAASCGTDGAFTGAISYRGYPLFFKENCVHKVYGSYPANYQIQASECNGVQKGCGKSLAIVNDKVYFKTRNGISSYEGSLPVDISYALGNVKYDSAIGGAAGNKYYVSMHNNDGYHLFVYDSQNGTWYKEDDLQVGGFCEHQGTLYAIDLETMNIVTMNGGGDSDYETNVPWMVETGEIGLEATDSKYISQLSVRLSVDPGSEVRVYAMYDFDDDWEMIYALNSVRLRTFTLPIRPKRCDHMKIKIEGEGTAKIYSITKNIEYGSDVH